jgi:hypothetical protein
MMGQVAHRPLLLSAGSDPWPGSLPRAAGKSPYLPGPAGS